MKKTRVMDTTQGEPMSPRNPYESQINDIFDTMRGHLYRVDPMAVLDEWGRSPPHLRPALCRRTEEWLISRLALPPTDAFPYADTQGLVRIMYDIWPEIPVRPFVMSMLPDIMARFDDYDRRNSVHSEGAHDDWDMQA